MNGEPIQAPPSRLLRAILLALVVLCSVTACSASIDSTKNPDPASSGLACVKGHDVPNGGNPYFVCDDYQPKETP